ncbi:MAG TPA: hypothetical protein ACQGQG_05870 [Xylella sp.]
MKKFMLGLGDGNTRLVPVQRFMKVAADLGLLGGAIGNCLVFMSFRCFYGYSQCYWGALR